jgi:hypothetical protein
MASSNGVIMKCGGEENASSAKIEANGGEEA